MHTAPLDRRALGLALTRAANASVEAINVTERDVVLSCFQQRFTINAAMAQFLELQWAGAYYDQVMGLFELCRARLGLDLHQVRYEDVVADPAAAVGAIRQVLDRIRPPSSVTTPAWEGSGSGSQHLIAGNPGRFDAGPLVLRPDVEWATAQPRGARAVATLVSSPLLHRYGYPLRPDRP